MWSYGPYGMMGYGGGWMMLLGGIFWLGLVAVIVFGIAGFMRGPQHPMSSRLGRRSTGLDILEERYARGEIQREEYLQKKRDLSE